MKILEYNHLDYSAVKAQYKKVIAMIQNDDFYSADVKKLAPTSYYRAKLDHSNRLLFKIVSYRGQKYALMLEIIHHHAYDKSKFLNGASINESQISPAIYSANDKAEPIIYINENIPSFNILDKIISFDDIQHEIFKLPFPFIIIGSAGSGKTVLTLEKMKECYGDILYITHSPFLVENSRDLYYAMQYSNEDQNLDFLSYRELLETVKVPEGKEINPKLFSAWLKKQSRIKLFNDSNKLYEEFKGVITGSIIHQKYLSRKEYINLGIKQSIFQPDERNLVYDLFEQYLKFLADEKLYDSNMVSFELLNLCTPRYDFIVVDEIQDFTNIQLYFILKLLKNKNQFILSGDSNQIVHPNFFSWSKVKSMFYEESKSAPTQIMRILHKNYRNSPEVTEIANNILKLKNLRFGSIDKESHYLVESQSTHRGIITTLATHHPALTELNQKTKKSTHYAVIVLYDDLKSEARKYFQTPLIFSIQEAKGLEYKNVILFNVISTEERKYFEMTKGISSDDLNQELIYSRVKDKSDRSLEIYKFYINALYVAITRAIDNLYLIEDSAKHVLMDLIGLKNVSDQLSLGNEESSLDEWRQEARKLELQGKIEQAEEIKQLILHQKQTPWKPIDKIQLELLKQKALDPAKIDKEARLLLFEYAVIYHQTPLINQLQTLNFKPAQQSIEKARDILNGKYFLFYNSHNMTTVSREIDAYGVDFRNWFNQTPLMVASDFGNATLIKHLIENGANSSLTDNCGRTALQTILLRAYLNARFVQSKLASIYPLLAPSSMSIKVEGKLIKVDNHQMEFFLFNLIAALTQNKFSEKYFHYRPGFGTADFLESFEHFPENVLLARRKKRSYITSILSKNEINRDDPYNRKLFIRTFYGRYLLNPGLEVKMNDEWIAIYDLLGLDISTILKNKPTNQFQNNDEEINE